MLSFTQQLIVCVPRQLQATIFMLAWSARVFRTRYHSSYEGLVHVSEFQSLWEEETCSGLDDIEHFAQFSDSEVTNVMVAALIISGFAYLWKRDNCFSPSQNKEAKLTVGRVLCNTSIMLGCFLLSFIVRLMHAKPATFWASSQGPTLSEAWHTFGVAYDVSHQNMFVFLVHTLNVACLPWLILSKSRKSLLEALLWGVIGLVLDLFAHRLVSTPTDYCLRNQFLHNWDSQSGYHILLHVLMEIPMNVYKLWLM